MSLRKSILFIFSAFFISGESYGQQLFSPAASTYYDEDYSISWSIGESAISSFQINDSLYLTQGLQQPFLICSPCDSIALDTQDLKNSNEFADYLQILPNVVSSQLNIITSLLFDGKGYMAIMDGNAQVLHLEVITYKTTEPKRRTMDISTYPPGKYFVKISNGISVVSTSFIKI